MWYYKQIGQEYSQPNDQNWKMKCKISNWNTKYFNFVVIRSHYNTSGLIDCHNYHKQETRYVFRFLKYGFGSDLEWTHRCVNSFDAGNRQATTIKTVFKRRKKFIRWRLEFFFIFPSFQLCINFYPVEANRHKINAGKEFYFQNILTQNPSRANHIKISDHIVIAHWEA